jgi:hypothetical protein
VVRNPYIRVRANEMPMTSGKDWTTQRPRNFFDSEALTSRSTVADPLVAERRFLLAILWLHPDSDDLLVLRTNLNRHGRAPTRSLFDFTAHQSAGSVAVVH